MKGFGITTCISLILLQLCMYLQDHPGLLENYTGIVKVFELLCEKSMKARDTNEFLP